MTIRLQVGDLSIDPEEAIRLLAGYQMLPQLVKEIFIDKAIADVECTEEEKNFVRQKLEQQLQLTTSVKRQTWLRLHGMTPDQLENFGLRQLKIEKFKQATWGDKVKSYFLNRKSQLDQAVYSLITTNNVGIAQELFFRIQEGEQSFAELAQQYGQGPESRTGGLIGPIELQGVHPVIAKRLSSSQPGQLWPPTAVGDWIAIVRLEKIIPAQLDDRMRMKLIDECFNNWLQENLTSQQQPFLKESEVKSQES